MRRNGLGIGGEEELVTAFKDFRLESGGKVEVLRVFSGRDEAVAIEETEKSVFVERSESHRAAKGMKRGSTQMGKVVDVTLRWREAKTETKESKR
jgi:hypothetical protein